MSEDHRADVLITATELAGLLGGPAAPIVMVLAIRNDGSSSVAAFENEKRIAGAIDVDLQSELASPQTATSGTRPLPDIARLQNDARRWGIRQGDTVVVYDHDRGLQAGRAWWVLRWAGIANVRLLDGGFAAWQAAGLPVVNARTARAPGDVNLSAGHLQVMTADDAQRMAREGVLLDSRIRPNYIGGPVPDGQPPRGHIPGAISAPAADNLADPGTFADTPTLRALYEGLGVDGQKKVGVYCGAGISAAHEVIALMAIGVEAAMYPGSWSAWASEPHRPVARGMKPG